MIKYTYKDKELKVPVGIGNITNESFEEGYDLGYEEGFKVAYPSGYTDGHVSGVTEQKAKLVSTAITENGTYSREDGFNEVEVDVQPPLETLSVSQSEEIVTYTPDDGYYGISNIEVNAEGYGAKRWQDGIDYEYNRVSQSAITLSFSGNGEWRKDFFSEVFCNEVIVNVPIDEIYQSGYTSGVTDGFAIGHSSGYTDGFSDGFSDGHVSGVTDGFATGHESGYTDGFAAGYPSGVTDGYASGYATGQVDGATAEHNKIATSAISLSFSGNGSWYQSGDVYCKEVYVSVPMFGSLFIVLRGENISLTAADVISINNFDISETIIRTFENGVGIFVSGRGRQQAGGGNDRIVITIPTSVYNQWTLSSCDLVAFNANSYEPFDSGIQTTPVSFRASTGVVNTQIIISLYDN